MSTAEVVVVGCMKTGNVIIPSSATNPSNGQKARVVEISNSAFANKTGIEMPPSSPAIEFADANVKAICVANWDTNGDGELSEAEAAVVTDLNHVFSEKTITSFNELQYFTGLSMIGDEEFSLCGDLMEIKLPASLSTIGERAFSGCCNLQSIEIPEAVSVIENQTFEGCSRLTSVTLPETLTRIGGGAFMGCRSLEDIHLPSSLITMSDAFDFCTSLRFIYIPKAVRYVSAFRECTSLESIVVDADNPYLDSRNDCNAIIETSTNKLIAGCGNTVIPEDVVAIGQMAFAGMTGLSEVTIPDGVHDIGFDAFMFPMAAKNLMRSIKHGGGSRKL